MKIRAKLKSWLLLIGFVPLAGCHSMSWPQMWPFPEYERTTYHTPAMRVDAVKQFGMKSSGVDSPEQREITDQLARQIQIEPDPLVRKAIISAVGEFQTPMAQQVLEAGLGDESKAVRVECCRELGHRAETKSVEKLAAALRGDKDVDVRLAAAAALGNIKSPEAIQALVPALDDRDPAMQYVGVESMKSITGKDFGPDVQAWKQVATSATPPTPSTPSLADRIRSAVPFQRR